MSVDLFALPPEQTRRRRRIAESRTVTGLDHVEIAGSVDWDARRFRLRLSFIPPAPNVIKSAVPKNLAVNDLRFITEPGGQPAPLRALRLVPPVPPDPTFVDVDMDLGNAAVADRYLGYRLVIAEAPALRVDPLFTAARFALDVDIPSEGDPRGSAHVALAPPQGPPIDYLGRDYEGLRARILDRLAVLQPELERRSPADLGVALVELMAYAGDGLAYYQDSVGTEAYLGTARRRLSVTRHARLLDYRVSNGSNARAWIALELDAPHTAAPVTVPGPRAESPGTAFVAGALPSPRGGAIAAQPLPPDAQIFEATADLPVHAALNSFAPYTWYGQILALPAGSTAVAVLFAQALSTPVRALLQPGRAMVLEQIRSPSTGRMADADPALRHAVRLSRVDAATDPLDEDETKDRLFKLEWPTEDALPFSFPIGDVYDPDTGRSEPLARLGANVLLADHGRSIPQEPLGTVPRKGPFRPRLAQAPLTQVRHALGAAGRLRRVDPSAPAASAIAPSGIALPDIVLTDSFDPSGIVWSPRSDLLHSDRFARDFVAEIDTDDSTELRFGDGQLGRRPETGAVFAARYRVGNGAIGNVAAETISTLAHPISGIVFRSVRNPMPAQGGSDPEGLASVRTAAPQAFKTEARAVSAQDYRPIAERYPDVQAALGDLTWTGSWYAVRVTVKRRGGRPVDAAFKAGLARFLAAYRLAGCTVLVDGPVLVPILIELSAVPQPGYLPQDVKASLADAFASGISRDGTPGYFDPDAWGFADNVYANRILTQAMAVPGVHTAAIGYFGRSGGPNVAGNNRIIEIGSHEIAQVANDPNDPDRGRIIIAVAGAA